MKGHLIHNGSNIPYNALKLYTEKVLEQNPAEWEREFFQFVLNFLNNQEWYEVKTSGSTGPSKILKIHRKDLEKSGRMTLDYLKLTPGMTALHCLPGNFIAGKMMFVRAILGDLNLRLIEPKRNPLSELKEHLDFIAITPHQLHYILKDASSREQLSNIPNVIVGGAEIDHKTMAEIADWQNRIFSTYGMTETLTHIALARLNRNETVEYQLIGDAFRIETDDRGCLLIQSPYEHMPRVQTNDLVELTSPHSFKWLGRYDNIINSGGIKIRPEEIEKALQPLIDKPFIVAPKPDKALGEKLVLIIESQNKNKYTSEAFKAQIANKIANPLMVPKEIHIVERLAYTENQKIHRKKTSALI